MNFDETLEKIHSFSIYGSKLGLHRMKRLLELLGNPHEKLKVIHVAGTNGKGSVCRYVYSVLQANGYRTGAYFSPYIERFTERIEFDNREISEDDLIKYSALVFDAVEKMINSGEESPTEFEVVTAIGFCYFAAENADFVVLEVGLGGRGDSTNVCESPYVTAITSISFDHMDRLGDTLEKIAAEKAGILKENVPMVVNVDDEAAFEVIKQMAVEKNSPLIDVRKSSAEIISESLDGFEFRASIMPFSVENGAAGPSVEDDAASPGKEAGSCYDSVKLSMTGAHQVQNAICALCIIEVLKARGLRLDDEKIKRGMTLAVQKARFEIMSRKPSYLILDGAHNEAGIRTLTDTVLRFFKGKRILLCTGILADKSFDIMAKELMKLEADIIVTEVPNPRKLEAAKLAEVFRKAAENIKETKDKKAGDVHSVAVEPDYKKAVHLAYDKRNDYDLVLWAGSLYLIGAVRKYIQEVFT